MSTQSNLHPLVEHESVTSSVLPDPKHRLDLTTLFNQVEEFEYLGRFHDAYKALQSSSHTYLLEARSPSYWYLFGTVKLSQGYYRDGLDHYKKAQKLLKESKEELSDGSQQLLAFMTTRLLCLDPASSAEDRDAGIETGVTAYQKWVSERTPDELDYFQLILERSYYEIIKDIPRFTHLVPTLYPRYIQIFKSQIPKGPINAVASFLIFLAIINTSQSLQEIKLLSQTTEKLLQDHKSPLPLVNTVKGYFQIRMGQLSENPSEQGKHFKEARRFYKAGGNIEAPCEVDLLDCLRDAQKHVLAGTDDPTDLRRRILHMIEKLGKLYGKFTDLDFPNRMHTTLKQITNINEKMLSSPDITLISCRLWRQLGKATGVKVNATTEFIAVIADIMKTDEIEESIAVFQRFKDEEEDNWDFDTGVNWLRGMAVAHTRLSQFDEAIAEMEMAETLLQSEWQHSAALDIREQILTVKERRLHTLSGVQKGYAFDDLLEEITEAILEDSRYWQQRKPMLRKMLWKAGLLLGDKELTPIEQGAEAATAIVNQVEQLATEYLSEDKTYQAFLNDCLLLKAILLRDQGKPDDAVSLIEKKLLPSKWKLRPRSEEEDIRAAELHLQAVIMYMKDLTTPSTTIPPKTLEKRIKSCQSHIKETLKLSEKHKLATIYSDALFYEAHCHVLQHEPRKALQSLLTVARIQDELRRSSPSTEPTDTKFDTFITNALAAQSSSSKFIDLSLKACLQIPDPLAAWYWIQLSKARAFTDLLRHGHIWENSFVRITEDIENFQMPWESVTVEARDIGLLYRLEKLLKSPVGYTLDNWDTETMEATLSHRRKTISSLISEISQRPTLRGALSVSMGLPATHEDLTWIANFRRSDEEITFVDWAQSFDSIIICIYRPAGIRLLGNISIGTSHSAKVDIITCTLPLTAVKNWVETYIQNQDTPLDSPNATDDLSILTPLIEPLLSLTNPSDLLVLSPTGIMHSIPIHAIPLPSSKTPLIERNPTIYVPSPSVLRQCLAKLRKSKTPESTTPSTLIGIKLDPPDNTQDPSVTTSLLKISSSLTTPTSTPQILPHPITKSSFTSAAQTTSNILHFHGHMDYSPPNPLHRSLLLSTDSITTHQLSTLRFPKNTAPLVSIISCLSGGQQTLGSDEPIGLIPALLSASAASVIATLWPTDNPSGLKFAEHLYSHSTPQDPQDDSQIWNIAHSLRSAVLEIKSNKETSAPYFWAPFVLHGAWIRGANPCGKLPRGDGMNGLSSQFARDMNIHF
ncbi:hypothetical protein TWF481_011607 [Arthrobotrys musiformis]|uniref:CHAT domain-containing protein n=1 Tax=Arthrobotrys musiformis TaxID=47236 RepID=A0AAV9W0X6_9PEZI